MRHLIVGALLIGAAVACFDRNDRTLEATAPAAPALTSKTLQKNSSSVCAATVAERDRLLSGKSATVQAEAAAQKRVRALSVVIADVCY